MIAASDVSGRAAQLRRDFDRGFAAPIHVEAGATEDLLAIRIGAQRCAIRLSEIAGLHAGKKITRVPGGDAALRGIAGFRGAMLPVYDLQALLGHPAAQVPRWMVIAATAPIALAFETFDGQLRVARDEILPQAARPDAPGYTREVARSGDFTGPIVHLPSVLDAIKATRGEFAPLKE
jgi:purine-binding chemotaxis protein CheW